MKVIHDDKKVNHKFFIAEVITPVMESLQLAWLPPPEMSQDVNNSPRMCRGGKELFGDLDVDMMSLVMLSGLWGQDVCV